MICSKKMNNLILLECNNVSHTPILLGADVVSGSHSLGLGVSVRRHKVVDCCIYFFRPRFFI